MTITKSGMILKVGRNFADAVSGKLACRGDIEVGGGSRRTWVSTVPIAEAEHALRVAAEKEHKKIIFFSSQAI